MIRPFSSLFLVLLVTSPAMALDSLDQARLAYQEASPERVIEILKRPIASPKDLTASELADARHLMGRALLDTGKPIEAALVLSTALQTDAKSDATALQDHLLFHLATAMLQLDRFDEALPLFRKVARDPYSPYQVDAAFHEAMSQVGRGKKKLARKALIGFLATYPSAPQMHDARSSLGVLEADRGRVARAIELFRRVIRESPQSDAANRAQLALDDLSAAGHEVALRPSAVEIRKDAEWLVRERRFDEALPVVLRLRAEAKRGRRDQRAERKADLVALTELLVKTYRGLGMLEKTLETNRWLKRHGGNALGSSTIVFLHGLLDQHDEAEALILRKHYRRKSAHYWTSVGDHRSRFGRYAEAEQVYLKAAKKSGRWIPNALNRKIAWSVFNQGDAERAISLLRGVGSRDSKLRTWSKYWIGRALQEAGRIEEATVQYQALQKRNETDFYGLLAGSRLDDMENSKSEPGEPTAPSNAAVDTNAAMDTLARVETIPDTPQDIGTLAWTPEMLTIDSNWELDLPNETLRIDSLNRLIEGWSKVAPEVVRAAELHRLGLLEAARNELRVLATDLRIMGKRRWGLLVNRGRSDMLDNRREKRARGGASLRHTGRRDRKMAREFFKQTRNGSFRTALLEARTALGDMHAIRSQSVRTGILRKEISENTTDDYRRAYPIAWPKAMSISTTEHDVPPAFLYGIMTTESSFHPHAVSVAHAYGLVQMIPRTGRRVALELGYGHFMPEILLEPDPSIYMGGRYMGRLLDRFYDQEPLAAAAYNCGPHRVADWLKANPNRPLDVFVEEIPYRQARRYTKRVLSHTARYRRLYYGESRMYVTNRLEARHRTTPNY
jgi:soluble lytic murein transglycosylase-like protein/tetratricopeptide (TPR) repeat protein